MSNLLRGGLGNEIVANFIVRGDFTSMFRQNLSCQPAKGGAGCGGVVRMEISGIRCQPLSVFDEASRIAGSKVRTAGIAWHQRAPLDLSRRGAAVARLDPVHFAPVCITQYRMFE